jgi:hypothetical protein
MPNNLQNIEYAYGHIDWNFDDGAYFGQTASGLKSAFWFLGDDPDGPVALCIDIPPNTDGREAVAHKHDSDQVRVFISGTFKIGNDWYKPGDVRIQEAGKYYGPEMAGPEGSRQILFFNKRSGVAADNVGTGIDAAGQAMVRLIAEFSRRSAA